MKKKFLIIISAMLFLLTGCMDVLIEEKDRNNIIDVLSDEGIIPDSWEFIDYQKECDWMLPTGDATGYDYIYKDEDDKYYTVYMTDLSYEKDTYYGDSEIFIQGGETYYLIRISECDVTMTTETFSSGNTYTSYAINTVNYDYEKYILHYDKLINVFRTDNLIIEPVIYYDEEVIQTEETT
ncbi:hypothetical protein [Porcipelethomonas sp.]|uniref:hypothetical protein n=1 Tax=Porcipelethomonas sp. TaxID=2981675 RepID=UPI003EF6E55C